MLEIPPPPAPPWTAASFQTVSGGAPTGAAPSPVSVVPPTPVTFGWLAGSSVNRPVLPLVLPEQSSDPLSPVAAKMLCPWAAISAKIAASAATLLAETTGSQLPQLVLTALAWSSVAIRW